MIRKILIAIEEWMFDDASLILALAKFFLVFGGGFFLVLFVFLSIMNAMNGHRHAVLDLTTTWDCTSSHTETRYVMHGKIGRWEPVDVCDNYKMR
jgi:hypothetical protein